MPRAPTTLLFLKVARGLPGQPYGKWMTEYLFLNKQDTPKYFQKYGVAVAVTRKIGTEGYGVLYAASTYKASERTVQTDEVCHVASV